MTRDARIDLRLSSEDKATIEAAAAERKQSVTEYVLAAATGDGPPDHLAEALAILRRIEASLNSPAACQKPEPEDV